MQADTEGDGTPDDLDGQPLDAGSVMPPAPEEAPGEPVVSVSGIGVNLDQTASSVTLEVANGGQGTLNWTALSDNEAVAVVSPLAPEVSVGPGPLEISAAPSYDFGVPGTVTTTVRVIDLGGDEKDFVDITVTVGPMLSDAIFGDGFETPP